MRIDPESDVPLTPSMRIMLWVVLALVLGFLFLIGFGTIEICLIAAGTGSSPFAGASPFLPVVVGAILAGLFLLLGNVARALYAALQDKREVHLLPLWAQLGFSLFFGVFGIAMAVFNLIGLLRHQHGVNASGVGVALVFLQHAGRVFWMMRQRSGSAPAAK